MEELITINENVSLETITNKDLKKACGKLEKAVMNIKKNALAVSEQLYIIKTQELFKDDFKTFSAFCENFGISKGRGSKLVAVWERLQETNGALELYNATQIEEMLPLEKDVNIDAVEQAVITPEMKTKEIREVVKDLTTKEETETDGTDADGTDAGTEEKPQTVKIKVGKTVIEVTGYTEEQVVAGINALFITE